jgi:hypothetical protein
MDDRMAHGEFDVLAYVRREDYDVYILNILAITSLIV